MSDFHMVLFRYLFLISPFIFSAYTFPSAQQYRHITVIYNNDEHGYMQRMREDANAATLLSLWQQQGYSPDGQFLLPNGGDNWTGPATLRWTQGESMTEVREKEKRLLNLVDDQYATRHLARKGVPTVGNQLTAHSDG